ncbi:unnamed protein product [Merluccius merluccius]
MTRFTYSDRDFRTDITATHPRVASSSPSTFDALLTSGWSDRMRRGGVFRYRLDELRTRVLPGPLSYVAQLNTLRGVERRKPQEVRSIKQSYDPHQFNFNRVQEGEVLFEMTRRQGPGEAGPEGERVMVVVNVSPLEFGHCLLVPEPSRCLPQVLTPLAVRTGMEAVLLSADPGFRVGFNSLGAFASVNHLHLHGYYLRSELLLETVAVRPLVARRGFYRLTRLPRGFMFYATADDLDDVARALYRVTETLVRGDVAHNLFLTRGCLPDGDGRRDEGHQRRDEELQRRDEGHQRRDEGHQRSDEGHQRSDEGHQRSGDEGHQRSGVRVALWPRRSCFGAKEERAFNVALCELAGHLPFKVQQDYECMTEDEVLEIIERYLLPEEDFVRLEKQLVADLMDL